MPEASPLRAAVLRYGDGALCEEFAYLNHVSRSRMFSFAAAPRRVVVGNDLAQAVDWNLRQAR